MSLMGLTAVSLGKKIRAGEVSAIEAAQEAFASIEKKEAVVNSFVTVEKERALERAKEVQKGMENGIYAGPLAGVPVAVKDNMCTKGILTTCSSKILENYLPEIGYGIRLI